MALPLHYDNITRQWALGKQNGKLLRVKASLPRPITFLNYSIRIELQVILFHDIKLFIVDLMIC
jgi:hypothetical protein